MGCYVMIKDLTESLWMFRFGLLQSTGTERIGHRRTRYPDHGSYDDRPHPLLYRGPDYTLGPALYSQVQ